MCRDPTETADDWFMNLVFTYLLKRHANAVLMKQAIPKVALFRGMLEWRRFSKRESRIICGFIASHYPGVRFTNRGLYIPDFYLERALECKSCSDTRVQMPTETVPEISPVKDAPLLA